MKQYSLIVFLFATYCAHSQELPPLKESTLEQVTLLKQQIHDVSQALWDYSETALLETKSANLLIGILKDEGFAIEKNIAGMPTAFIARWGNGSPTVGILAEYDALPGVGNLATPIRAKRLDGVTNGQGCGHNLFGAASVNAAIAVKRTLETKKIQGTVVLFGAPAEETLVGKVYMAKEEAFEGVDAVVDWHPGLKTNADYRPTLAMNNFEVEFFGQSAHGAADPWNGRSALDAVEMMNFGANLMREHIHPTARIHYVISNGGVAPNVVPDYAKVRYFVRDTSRTDVDIYYNWLLDIAEGAALATKTTHKVQLITGVYEYNLNAPLIFAIQKNLKIVGAPEFNEKDQIWAKKLQEEVGVDELGFYTEIDTIPNDWEKSLPKGGSTDVGDVSMIAPTARFRVATAPLGVPWHSWAVTACHGTNAGYKAAEVAAKVIALTTIDILTDKHLLLDAKQYFHRKTKGIPYKSALPEDQKVILPKDVKE